MTCELCKTTEKTWKGADRKCAFEVMKNDEYFQENNWSCASMLALRAICQAKELIRCAGDEHYAVLPVHEVDVSSFNYDSTSDFDSWQMYEQGNVCLVVTWYKNRGRTTSANVIGSEGMIHAITEEFLVKVLDYYGRNTTTSV